MTMPRSAALFGSSTASRSSNLVEFRAGKMIFRSSDNMVLPDKRLGKLYLHQSEDGLMHLCWKERSAIHAEDDFLIFPEDAIFIPVKKCPSGRVYLLRFKAGRKFFFWMQEPNVERDQELVKKINDNINNPPSVGSGASGRRVGRGGASGLGGTLGNNEMQDLLGGFNLNQSDLLGLLSMQLSAEDADTRASSARSGLSDANEPALTTTGAVTPAGSSATTASVAAPKKSRPNTAGTSNVPANMKFRREDLQNIFSTMGSGAVANLIGGGYVRTPLLSDVLKTEHLKPFLNSEEAVQSLLSHVPEGSSISQSASQEEKVKCIMDALQSPFFKAAVRTFSSAFQSGEIGPVVSQFQLGENVSISASQGDLIRFSEALEAQEKSNIDKMDISMEEEPKADKKEAEEEHMEKD